MRGVPADLHLDPEALRRAAYAARRIADGLDAAAAPLPRAVEPVLDRAQEDLRDAVLRVRGELLDLAGAAAAAATRAEEADRAVASRLSWDDARGTSSTPLRRPTVPVADGKDPA